MVDDPRDPRLAELLDVEPLDELTRRRMVTRALDESAPARPGRSWQLLAVAAAIVAVMTVGLVVLLDGSGSDDVTTSEQALRPSSSAAAGSAAGDTSGDASSAADGAASPAPEANAGTAPSAAALEAIPYAGDFGDLSTRASRTTLLDAVAGPPAEWTAAERSRTTTGLDHDGAAALADAASCSDPVLALGRLVGYASGRFGDRPATVLVVERADGTRVVRAVLSEPCEVRDIG